MLKGIRSPHGIFGEVPPKVKWLILLMFFSSLATGYFWVATSAYLPQVGISSSEVGLILAINGVAFMLTAIPMGLLADRTGRKKILLAGVLGMPPTLLVYALTSDLTFLLAASAVAGIAEGAFLTTWNALIADMTTGQGRKEAFALSFIVSSVSVGLGFALPLAFPLISELSGWDTFQVHNAFFVILAAVSLITPITLARLLKDYVETPIEGVSLRKGKNMGPMLKFSAFNSLIGLGAGFIIPLIPLVAAGPFRDLRHLQRPPAGRGHDDHRVRLDRQRRPGPSLRDGQGDRHVPGLVHDLHAGPGLRSERGHGRGFHHHTGDADEHVRAVDRLVPDGHHLEGGEGAGQRDQLHRMEAAPQRHHGGGRHPAGHGHV